MPPETAERGWRAGEKNRREGRCRWRGRGHRNYGAEKCEIRSPRLTTCAKPRARYPGHLLNRDLTTVQGASRAGLRHRLAAPLSME